MEHPPYRLAESLEGHLGDPDDPRRPFSYARCLELDEKEEFPAEICAQLDSWGVPDYYVPAEHGGRLENYEQILHLVRTLARRDLTVAIGHGKTYLGGVCVWVSGTPEQARRLGGDIRAGLPVSLGLTERAHGSDLLAGEVSGDAGPAGWRVDGEKWLINNATRGTLLALLTRTDPDAGPRGFSVLLVDKRELAEGTYTHLDKNRTHGIRGADISGISFDGALVPRSALVGAVGGGVETVLKALQLTRTMCASLSLGAADHALAIGLDFAEERTLYGRQLADLPQARHVLVTAAADALAHEALALVASRQVHTATAELSVTAAVTKYLLPSGTERVLADLTRLLGARAFLKGVYAGGMFQKVERDHRIVGLFDGNTLVNLNSVVNQFRSLVRAYRRGRGDLAGANAAYDLAAPLAPLDPAGLSLVARQGSGVTASLAGSVAEVRRRAAADPALAGLADAAQRALAATGRVHDEMERHQDALGDVPPAAFETARRYALCYAAAACLGLWTRSVDTVLAAAGPTAPLWRDGVWARTALDRLLVRLGEPGTGDTEAYGALLEGLRRSRTRGEVFSLLPLRGGAAAAAHPPHAEESTADDAGDGARKEAERTPC
ncbi:acyl-CoA dehydrogenase family protein [Streptomyces sp. NPDC050560]|uniref:acyl-CoA dehydrogenase family protein n=1 Tax=Streptomyces sp. NPDC050560 TaxID=3365630 RepID=UPI0037A03045